jgi:septal ring factor EnvC (AmiA/AmiB activator)
MVSKKTESPAKPKFSKLRQVINEIVAAMAGRRQQKAAKAHAEKQRQSEKEALVGEEAPEKEVPKLAKKFKIDPTKRRHYPGKR